MVGGAVGTGNNKGTVAVAIVGLLLILLALSQSKSDDGKGGQQESYLLHAEWSDCEQGGIVTLTVGNRIINRTVFRSGNSTVPPWEDYIDAHNERIILTFMPLKIGAGPCDAEVRITGPVAAQTITRVSKRISARVVAI